MHESRKKTPGETPRNVELIKKNDRGREFKYEIFDIM
jgi:hypothetical protein